MAHSPIDPPCCPLPEHISTDPNVYEPREDTYLLLDTLHFQKSLLRERKPLICVEIGGGSGAITAAIASLLTHKAYFLVTDINPTATTVCKETLVKNRILSHDVLNMDLLHHFEGRINEVGGFDLLVFNPPYVVTSPEEINERFGSIKFSLFHRTDSSLSSSWAGGLRGRQVLDRLLYKVGQFMSENGLLYLVAIKENNPEEICTILLKQGFVKAEIIAARRALNEDLVVIRALMRDGT